MIGAPVILVEADVTSPAGGASVLRFADRAFAPMAPSDPDRPNAAWDDRLVASPNLRRALFEDVTTLAPALGLGAMTLANGDRGLDAYQAFVWGELRVWRWPQGAPFAQARMLFRGPSAPPAYSRSSANPSQVSVAFYDYRAELAGQLQADSYAGTNASGALYEGEADGLKGRPKPLAFGNLLGAQLPAPQVNAGSYVYQLHDGPIAGAEQIFDRGDNAGFAAAGDRSGSSFDLTNPPAASYSTDRARSLVKINGQPVGTVTFGLKGDATGGYVETPGAIAARLLARAGVPAARIDASVAALPSTAVVGVWDAQGATGDELIAGVARAALAAVLPDRTGAWGAVSFGPPALTAALVIAEDDVVAIQADDAAPLPVAEVRVGWGRIWTTFAGGDLAPALKGTASAERLAAEYRYAVLTDPVLKARLPGAWRSVQIDTPLRLEADAQALASQLKAMFGLRPDGRPRMQWSVQLELTDALLAVPLGATVRVVYPPFGLDDRLVLIAEEPLRPKRNLVTWTLWG